MCATSDIAPLRRYPLQRSAPRPTSSAKVLVPSRRSQRRYFETAIGRPRPDRDFDRGEIAMTPAQSTTQKPRLARSPRRSPRSSIHHRFVRSESPGKNHARGPFAHPPDPATRYRIQRHRDGRHLRRGIRQGQTAAGRAGYGPPYARRAELPARTTAGAVRQASIPAPPLCLTSAPIRRPPPRSSMPCKASMRLISTSISGDDSRMLSVGIRLCPPASTWCTAGIFAEQLHRFIDVAWTPVKKRTSLHCDKLLRHDPLSLAQRQ